MAESEKTQRIRDPIHDIIQFEKSDLAAWRLIETADMQRLRRVKQLGVSEFVYPSATHTRFAHSIGVFHNARRLLKLIKREIDFRRTPGEFDESRAKVALFAAMLHDIGHGPFSHAFEEARKEIARLRSETNPIEKHEAFSGKMIEDSSGEIGSILDDAGVNPQDVARLIQKETPEDMYHAIVSSSFDADRLDYLMRDRYMTGTGAGAIDLEWLMDNVRVASLDFSLPDGTETAPIHRSSFCLLFKARDAAEDFLLARYRLYANVYFHKTTRGIEQLLSAFFRVLAVHLDAGQQVVGLSAEHPLIRFFARDGGDLTTYRLLDDTVVWGALHTLAHSGAGEIKELAYRVLFREKPYCVDLQNEFPGDDEKQRRLKNRITKSFENTLGKRVFQDIARLSIYGEIGADDDRAQKRLLILPRHGEPQEITKFEHSTIASEQRPRLFERFYFLDKADYTAACGHVDSVRIGNAGRNT